MPVHDLGYRRWKGEFRSRGLRFLPMVRYHLADAMKRRLVWLILFVAMVPAIVLTAMIYIGAQAAEGSEGGLGPIFQGVLSQFGAVDRGDTGSHDPFLEPQAPAEAEVSTLADQYWLVSRYGFQFFLVHIQGYFVLLISSVVGAGLVARDLKSNALEVYLTKPITAVDYILGKLTIVACFVFAVTFLPALMLFTAASSLWVGFFSAAWPILFCLTGFCALVALVNGMVILGLSSLAKSARFATVFWFSVAFITGLVGIQLSMVTHSRTAGLVSYRENFNVLAGWVFRTRPFQQITDQIAYQDGAPSILIPLMILGAYVSASILILRRTIRSLENR